MKKIIIVGGPGAGKGSLAKYFARDFNIPHISSGEIFRENIKNKTPLGIQVEELVNSGTLVSDEVTTQLIFDRLEQSDCKGGFVLDGFPRTLVQAELLSKHTDIDFVIDIRSSTETVISRLCGRYMCSKCALIHNKLWHDTSACRTCGAGLYQREDDKEEIIRKRLDDYHKQFAPILEFYNAQPHCMVLGIESQLAESPQVVYENFMEQYAEVFRKTT